MIAVACVVRRSGVARSATAAAVSRPAVASLPAGCCCCALFPTSSPPCLRSSLPLPSPPSLWRLLNRRRGNAEWPPAVAAFRMRLVGSPKAPASQPLVRSSAAAHSFQRSATITTHSRALDTPATRPAPPPAHPSAVASPLSDPSIRLLTRPLLSALPFHGPPAAWRWWRRKWQQGCCQRCQVGAAGPRHAGDGSVRNDLTRSWIQGQQHTERLTVRRVADLGAARRERCVFALKQRQR